VDDSQIKELKLRVLSAGIFGPVTLAAVYFGTPYFETFMIVAALAMTWEWERICCEGRYGASGWVLSVTVGVACILAWAGRIEYALYVVALGLCGGYAVAALSGRGASRWIGPGVVVIGLPCVTAIWLRADPAFGLKNMIWLIGAVWATDVAAYVVGKKIGGRRLAPRISPGKTWAGLFGGMLGAGCWAYAWGVWGGASELFAVALLGVCFAVVAQTGDLGISFVKRRFGVKDASNLIPGHGGVLDRFDGLLSSAPVMALLLYSTRGSGLLWE